MHRSFLELLNRYGLLGPEELTPAAAAAEEASAKPPTDDRPSEIRLHRQETDSAVAQAGELRLLVRESIVFFLDELEERMPRAIPERAPRRKPRASTPRKTK